MSADNRPGWRLPAAITSMLGLIPVVAWFLEQPQVRDYPWLSALAIGFLIALGWFAERYIAFRQYALRLERDKQQLEEDLRLRDVQLSKKDHYAHDLLQSKVGSVVETIRDLPEQRRYGSDFLHPVFAYQAVSDRREAKFANSELERARANLVLHIDALVAKLKIVMLEDDETKVSGFRFLTERDYVNGIQVGSGWRDELIRLEMLCHAVVDSYEALVETYRGLENICTLEHAPSSRTG